MKFDKEATEGALLGILYANNQEDALLSQLYNRMRVDDRIDINMPRLLKAIAAAINKGYVEWGFNGYSSDTSLDLVAVFHLTDKGILKAQELAEEGQPHLSKKTQEKAEEPEETEHAWDDEFAEYDDESDDEDEFAKEDYEDDAPEDYEDPEDPEDYEDSEDSEDEAEDESEDEFTAQGINSDESTDALGSITPRTVAINKDEAYWVDTHDELTPEEYKDILGVSREEFKDSFNEALDKAIDNAIEYHENGGIEDEEEYPEDDYIEDEDEDESTDDDDCAQFCHICGTIADLQDNFCCVCGNRLFPVLQDPVIVKVIPTRKPSLRKADVRDEAARQSQRQQDKLDNIEVLYNMFEKLGIL